MMRFIACLLAVLLGVSPVLAQYTGPLPSICSTNGTGCASAMPVVNPDGTFIGGGGGGTTSVQGVAAHDAVSTGNPVLNGGYATLTAPTAVQTGDAVRAWYGLTGNAFTSIVAPDGTNPAGTILNNADGRLATNIGLLSSSWPYVFNGTSWDRARGDTTGAYVVPKGTATLATNQISVGTTSTLVAAARAGRAKITLSVGAANTCAFGNTGVTTTTGFPLQPVAGASFIIETTAAVYAACSATTTVSFIESY